ncbi:MAG TPA: phosphoenolpyruvate--protein phosphotransferase [Burkholderiales bacterium]|nr:phosphoenolpyruvate--protein phosphotransferase [Burkholderiales bacterium]
MQIERGKAVAPGFGDGRAHVYRPGSPRLVTCGIAPSAVAAEQARFSAALARATERLERLEHAARTELGPDNGDIFAAHLALLRDSQFIERINGRIATQLESAEQAIDATVGELAQALGQADDENFRERAQDIRDLGRWVQRQLGVGLGGVPSTLPPNTILVAQELLPSDLLQLDRAHVAGIVTEAGGEVGHVAILARAIGVPYVTGLHDATERIRDGMRLLLDGQTGEVWLEPDAPSIDAFAERKRRYDEQGAKASAQESWACSTRDGVRIFLLANIGRAKDAQEVARHNLDGVGLFRTEYMFLDEAQPPSLERQRQVYEEAASLAAGLPVVIRTLDLGGDKRPAFLAPQFEANPNLGLRGLRFSLTVARDLFRTQLRAIVQAARHGNVRVLFPMVLGRHDLRQAIALLDELCSDEGCKAPPVGAMIETPAAVLTIGEILDLVEFVSIGTNDLTQFVLAADRNAVELLEDYSALHPAVLRAVGYVADAANSKGKSVSVCGEAAADPATAGLFVGLGVRTLSMSPASTARVRYLLGKSDCTALKQLAQSALALDDPKAIEALLQQAGTEI